MTWFDWAKEYLAKWKAAQSRPSEMPNFTPRACKAIALARTAAERLHHNFLGTEHLLLGLVELGQGVATNVLCNLGLDLGAVRIELEKQIQVGLPGVPFGDIPFTPRMKKVLSLAQKNAKEMKHTYVSTEDLLLGLLEDGDGLAAKVLRQFKINPPEVRQEILKELDPSFYLPDDNNQDRKE